MSLRNALPAALRRVSCSGIYWVTSHTDRTIAAGHPNGHIDELLPFSPRQAERRLPAKHRLPNNPI